MSSTRRQFLAAAAAAAVVAACARSARRRITGSTTTAAPAVTTSTTTPSAAATGGPARFVRTGPTDTASVAFTFHGSGDIGLLHDLLDAARAANAPVTIFAVGTWLDANPDVATLIAAAGHELANHTYTHPALGTLAPHAIATEITGCRDALRRHAGNTGRWFRPSGIEIPTAAILAAAGGAGYDTVVGYDVDPHDYQDPGADLVLQRVTAGLHPGAIVSLHTGHRGTVTVFGAMVAAARRRALTPVTVSALLS